ncbi:hypothetical protein J1C09_000092 [Escherichia coli]|nr:hypothetical protein [Escherichia coli]
MNLVMSDITRNKLGCYMAQQASLNNIPVSALVSRFTVEPSVQQRFENAVKESTEFTKKINVFGVTDQKGEKILLDTTGPIARTNTSYDGTKRRNPNNVVDLKNRKYQCEQVNYDTFISYPQLDAWAAHPDFQSRVSTQIARQVALDRIMIGFNGTSHADESNFSTNKLLQDVNVGWLEHIRTDASERVMNDVTLTSRNMDNTVAHAGKYANADALVKAMDKAFTRVDETFEAIRDSLNQQAINNIARKLAQDLRRAQQARIRSQKAPDGTAWTPRRRRVTRIQERIRFIWNIHLKDVGVRFRCAVAPEAEPVATNNGRDFFVVEAVGIAVFGLQRPEHMPGHSQHIFNRNVGQRFVPALLMVNVRTKAARISRRGERFVFATFRVVGDEVRP